jgi:choline dehydrogenase-like flavoprotein
MDPVTSASKTDCRAQLDNLQIMATKVFPIIGAMNPALTAIANALRLGDHQLPRLA